MPSGSKNLVPQNFILIKPLPILPQKGLKIQARSAAVYNPCEPPRELVFWENYRRRQLQLTQQGYKAVSWRPYQELGHPLYLEPTKLILHSLGQLEQAASDERYSPPEEADNDVKIPGLLQDSHKTHFRQVTLNHRPKELESLNKNLFHTRQLVRSVKLGHSYFHLLKREEQEKQDRLLAEEKAAAEKRKNDLQPPVYSSDDDNDDGTESQENSFKPNAKLPGTKRKSSNETGPLRPFTPRHVNLAASEPKEAALQPLFRQLCALHWLLETLTTEYSNSFGAVATCWDVKDPGGSRSLMKRSIKNKLTETKWEQFITQAKLQPRKPVYNIARRQQSVVLRRTSSVSISKMSVTSGNLQTSATGSMSSLIQISDDMGLGSSLLNSETAIEGEDAESMNISNNKQKKDEEGPMSNYLQKLLETVHERIARDSTHEDTASQCTTGSQSVTGTTGKENIHYLAINSPDKGTNTNISPRRPIRKRWENSTHKFRTLENIGEFRKDFDKIKKTSHVNEVHENKVQKTEQKTEDNWYATLLSSLPKSVKENHNIQRILEKLARICDRGSIRIRQTHFLKVLGGLRIWELCSPEMSAATEFIREKIIKMPEDDYNEWLQSKVGDVYRTQSAPPMR
ncbi:coiled-coil domain-containing protein 60 isoform X2 [Protopterus annectens]|uniref:coiled-coil domain-containing protein 60 isoform X2 n=1 Tax=Protopterus annectens TaxID=7888 RepID=UPI001CFA8340|nr:coiled-coil domain-containing protein 60 isoform X2 [Protopterus annectens]